MTSGQSRPLPAGAAEARRAPLDIFDNDLKLGDVVDAYAPRNIALAVAVPAVITLVAHITNVAFGSGGLLGIGGLISAWALVLAHVPAMAVARAMLVARRRKEYRTAYWAQSFVQFFWLQLLCLSTSPIFSVVGMAIFCAWAFNDAWFHYDALNIRLQYALAFPAFDLMLLLVDSAGGNGLMHLLQAAPTTFWMLLTVQGLLGGVAQVVIHFAGRQAADHDLRASDVARLEMELAVVRKERTVIQQSCSYLTQGLTASKFSHDVANPVGVITGNLQLVEMHLDLAPTRLPVWTAALESMPEPRRAEVTAAFARWEEELRDMLEDVSEGADRVLAMTRLLARSLRTGDSLEPQPVVDLVRTGVDEMRVALQGQQVEAPDPVVDLEPCDVVVTKGHASSLGNILANGALQKSDVALEVTGRRSGDWFYLLEIRDFGVQPDAREAALEQVNRSLALTPGERKEPGARVSRIERRPYRGYGIGLMMAKLLFTRYNGWLSVGGPAGGPGLVFRVALPLRDPKEIPDAVNHPERVAR